MKRILYTPLLMSLLCFLSSKGQSQEISLIQADAMKQRIITYMSVSEKRAVEIQKALDYHQKEIGQLLLSKKLHLPDEMANLRKLVSESQVYIGQVLTLEEKGKLGLVMLPEVRQRQQAALQQIASSREQQGLHSNKKN